jgi:hypothetical protein
VKIPIQASNIPDFRGFQIKLELPEEIDEFQGIEEVRFPLEPNEFSELFTNLEKNILIVDCAFFMKNARCLSYNGPLFYVKWRISENYYPGIKIRSALIRDRFNREYDFKINEKSRILPKQYSLSQAYPNPFNSSTKFNVILPKSTNIRLEIFNNLGQKINSLYTGVLQAGVWNFNWNGIDFANSEVPSGMYYLVLNTKEFSRVRKILLLK